MEQTGGMAAPDSPAATAKRSPPPDAALAVSTVLEVFPASATRQRGPNAQNYSSRIAYAASRFRKPGMTVSRPSARARRFAAALGMAALLPAAALAGPPFRTDDPEPVDYQHWELTLFSQGTQTEAGTTTLLPAFEANYGALPNLQLHAILPLDYESQSGSRPGFAQGDVELGFKYRFLTPGDDDWFPQAAIFPTAEVPTGNQKLGFGTGHAQYFLPLWLQKDFDPWTVYGGAGYWINPGSGNRNYEFFGAALWRKVTGALNVGVEVFNQTSPAAGVPDSTGCNAGLTYDLSDNWHVLASAGSGLQNRNSTNRFSYYLGLQLTF